MPVKRHTLKFRGKNGAYHYSKWNGEIRIIKVREFTPTRFGYNIIFNCFENGKSRYDTTYTLLEAKLKATDLWCQFMGKPAYLK